MTPDTTGTELCDSAKEWPLGSWLMCEARGPHAFCWAREPMGRTHRWPNPNAQQATQTQETP